MSISTHLFLISEQFYWKKYVEQIPVDFLTTDSLW